MMTSPTRPSAGAGEKSNRLAIDGGTPVRHDPLPWEFPGGNRIGAEELLRVRMRRAFDEAHESGQSAVNLGALVAIQSEGSREKQ
jgi:hypothetical protein